MGVVLLLAVIVLGLIGVSRHRARRRVRGTADGISSQGRHQRPPQGSPPSMKSLGGAPGISAADRVMRRPAPGPQIRAQPRESPREIGGYPPDAPRMAEPVPRAVVGSLARPPQLPGNRALSQAAAGIADELAASGSDMPNPVPWPGQWLTCMALPVQHAACESGSASSPPAAGRPALSGGGDDRGPDDQRAA